MRPSLLILLTGCGAAGAVTTGPVMAPMQHSPVGVEFDAFVAAPADDLSIPNAYGIAVRQIGDEHVQKAVQAGWASAGRLGGSIVFARLMFDLIAWQQRMDGDDTLSALSPTFSLGIAPLGHGVCLGGSATWDLHFTGPDRLLVGAFLGLCGAKR